MRRVASGVWQIDGFPRNAINAYLIEDVNGDVLIDAGIRWDQRRYLKALTGRRLALVALTHAHPDHQGSAKAVCEAFQVPLVCHAADRDVMEGRSPMGPPTWQISCSSRVFSGPPFPVTRELREGDEVVGFQVVETPGHTPGHVSYFRRSDGVLIVGDVVANMNFITLRQVLREPPPFFSFDPAQNRRSMVKLSQLRPKLCLFGHGAPLSDLSQWDDLVKRLG